jgi:hypothetical protein
MQKYNFSGHETFHCRHFWLKKGYDFILSNDFSFGSDQSTVTLGVGKNMVTSISFWTHVFGLRNADGVLSEFSHSIFDDEGHDPYLEDIGTMWLLHYKLFHSNRSSIYKLVLREYRKSKVDHEFTTSQLVAFIERWCAREGESVNRNTLENDVKVFLRNYVTPMRNSKSLEDDYSALFLELNIIDRVGDTRLNGEPLYRINLTARQDIPAPIFLYAILESFPDETSIDIDAIQEQVGDAFLTHRDGTEAHLARIAEIYAGDVVFKSDAGRKELQLKSTLDASRILEGYYE